MLVRAAFLLRYTKIAEMKHRHFVISTVVLQSLEPCVAANLKGNEPENFPLNVNNPINNSSCTMHAFMQARQARLSTGHARHTV